MPARLQPETTSPSRRAVLAAALGGAAAMVARTALQPSPARAAGDDNSPILVGSTFLDVRTGTYLSDAANNNTVLSAVSSSAGGFGGGTAVVGVSGSGAGVAGSSNSGTGVDGVSGSSYGVRGRSTSDYGVFGSSSSSDGVRGDSTSQLGVHGSSGSNVGVWGESGSSVGVRGDSGASYGVYGYSTATNQPGTLAQSGANATGLLGVSGTVIPAAPARTGVFGYAAQSSESKGVWGKSPAGHGLHGESGSGWAGYFDGRVLVNRFVEVVETATPSAPGRNHAKLFIRDNGSGKTQLCVRFHTGSVRVLATQP